MYNVYDKPWRAGGGLADKIYRPSKGMDKDIYGDDCRETHKNQQVSESPLVCFVWLYACIMYACMYRAINCK